MRNVVRVAACLAVVSAALVVGGGAQAIGGSIVISQVYGGGGNSGAAFKNDFIELYNPGTTAVDLGAWSVQYAATTGTNWQRTNLSGTLAAGAYYLIQEAAGTGGTTSLPPPDATGSISMSATAGKVALVGSQTTIASGTACPTGTIDLVGYGSGTNCFEGTGPAATLSNTSAAVRTGNGATDTNDNAADFTTGAPNPHSSSTGGGDTGHPAKIDEIQGSGQFSQKRDELVSDVQGVVTAIKSTGSARGFFMQDPQPDADPATSEGIFVFTGSTTPSVHIGDAVTVAGTVREFISSGSGDLPETELVGPTTTIRSSGNALPAPVVIGQGGLEPPTQSVTDGIAFDESLEGMLVQLNDVRAVSRVDDFGEVWVVPDNGAGAGVQTPRGGILLQADDANPEKFRLDDDAFPASDGAMPTADVGATASGPQVGVMDYTFDNYTIHLLHEPTWAPSPIAPETTTVTGGADELTVATFNVENLAPQDPASKFDGLADVLVNRLRAPDIVALEEVQDNTGATDDGVVDSTLTLDNLRDAVLRAGGPRYDYRWVNPVDDADGGQPGGNIRVVFFFRTDVAGLSFAPGTSGGSTDAETVVGSGAATTLKYNPGRIDPASTAWDASRKPLVGQFVFDGHSVFVIANHFVSKLGDEPLWGLNQPPVNESETQRHQQAHEVADFVSSLLAADPQANVIALGDLNDFQFSDTVSILEDSGLRDLIDELPLGERYTYVFDGNSQAIDHMLIAGGLVPRPRDYDVVHVNSELVKQVSDHDPQVAAFTLDAPTATAGPFSVDEGSSTTLSVTASDPSGGPLSIAWDLDGNGSYETPGATAAFSAASLDGPSSRTVGVQVTAPDGAVTTTTARVEVRNVPPTATFSAPATVFATEPIELALSGATDASAADRNTGFEYAFDCGDGYGAPTTRSTTSCPTDSVGTRTVRGKVIDKDGGSTVYTATVSVRVTVDSLCAAATRWAKNGGIATSLCAQLDHGQITAFGHEVAAQSGKSFTNEQAATLIRLSQSL